MSFELYSKCIEQYLSLINYNKDKKAYSSTTLT